ncbi:hypothetical protein HU200_054182 [Digitaria exilis]|uniref:Uncharacterized protein n=1 Tax=Digitaria exilis TaxID=1010633 RepID=A0A835AMW5_9POAL|nr:hypothetical protein HU200_054182 [Digitaria exilis]
MADIHKLDADNMEEHLPKHAALRVASPERGNPMAFATLGTNIFIVSSHDRAPPILVYDTANAALAVGPRPPVGYLGDFGQSSFSLQLQFCSWGANPDQHEPWDPPMAWTWNTSPAPPSQLIGEHLVTAYALHPDGHTVFVSTDGGHTHFRWTPVMACGETLGHGPYYDGELDAWVGLHHEQDGYVCCCPVASRRSDTARRPPLDD